MWWILLACVLVEWGSSMFDVVMVCVSLLIDWFTGWKDSKFK